MRILIVGLGSAGSMAAWRLSSAGHEVVAFEQFDIDHDLGSSFGESRIVRRVYPDPLYTGLMAESYELWDELQEAWRRNCPDGPDSDAAELISRGGGLFIGPPQHPDILGAQSALTAHRVVYEKLDATATSLRYPAFRLQPDAIALFEPTMGYARASNAVRAAITLAERSNAVIHRRTAVTEIDPSGPAVVTDRGERFAGDHILVTAGPWSGRLLARYGVELPVKVTRQAYIHLEPESHYDATNFLPERFPCWIDTETNIYGFPHLSLPGVKIASHDQGAPCTPDSVERQLSESDLAPLTRYAQSHFAGLSGKVIYSKVCLYSNTASQDFVIDRIGGSPTAHFISACSGHGFKFAPLIGEIAAELALGSNMNRDLSRFRLTNCVPF